MICFDTSPLIWGVRGEAEDGQEDMIVRTQKYVRHLGRQKSKVFIPAPVLAEYLVGSETPKKRRKDLEELAGRQFRIYPLDTPAAYKAAEIFEMDFVRQLVKQGADRQCLKVDAMIVAIAIMRKADYIVSNDPHITRLAYKLMKVVEVPDISEQPELFGSPTDV